MALALCVLQSAEICLPQLAKTVSKIEPEVEVSGQAFKACFTEFAVKFLKVMFAEALKVTAPNEAQVVPLLSSFSEVNLLDSSVVNLPDAVEKEFPGHGGVSGKAAVKVYLLLEWLHGRLQNDSDRGSEGKNLCGLQPSQTSRFTQVLR